MKLGVLLIRTGKIPMAKGSYNDTAEGRRMQHAMTVELRKIFPESTLVPFAVTDDGDVWPEAESEFLHKWEMAHA